MLQRPSMYIQTKESLEDVYWALNCIRGTFRTVTSESVKILKEKKISTNQPLSSSCSSIEELRDHLVHIEQIILDGSK